MQEIDNKIKEKNIKRTVFGKEYINTVREFGKIESLCNHPFGVYTHLDYIELLMVQ